MRMQQLGGPWALLVFVTLLGLNDSADATNTCLYDIFRAARFKSNLAKFYEERYILGNVDISAFSPASRRGDGEVNYGPLLPNHRARISARIDDILQSFPCGRFTPPGVCSLDKRARLRYICTCPPGRTGDRCERDVCEPNPCGHGKRCFHSAGGYECACPEGFGGPTCEVHICDARPCQNGGLCRSVGGQVLCTCTEGFTGDLCQRAVDRCASSPCVNGGTCSSLGSAFSCHCPAQFFGSRCQLTMLDEDKDRPHIDVGPERPVQRLPPVLPPISRTQTPPPSDTTTAAAQSPTPGGNLLPAVGLDEEIQPVNDREQLEEEEGAPIFKLEDPDLDIASAVTDTCQGIVNWRYIPWSSWRSGEDSGLLRLGSYMKKRDDTYLKLTFSSVFMQIAHDQCAQWSIKIDGRSCSEPAPIQTIVHTFYSQSQTNYANRRPAQLIGMCRASERGPLMRGNHAVSVHVATCPGYDGADASTGWPGGLTSFLLVEEYCPPT